MAKPCKYKPGIHPEQLLELMTQGYSQSGAGGLMGVSQQTLSEWTRKYPEFSEAYGLGKLARQAFYEKAGHDGMQGLTKNFNATVWKLVSQSEFGMSERSKTEINANVKQTVTIQFVDDDTNDG